MSLGDRLGLGVDVGRRSSDSVGTGAAVAVLLDGDGSPCLGFGVAETVYLMRLGSGTGEPDTCLTPGCDEVPLALSGAGLIRVMVMGLTLLLTFSTLTMSPAGRSTLVASGLVEGSPAPPTGTYPWDAAVS